MYTRYMLSAGASIYTSQCIRQQRRRRRRRRWWCKTM